MTNDILVPKYFIYSKGRFQLNVLFIVNIIFALESWKPLNIFSMSNIKNMNNTPIISSDVSIKLIKSAKLHLFF